MDRIYISVSWLIPAQPKRLQFSQMRLIGTSICTRKAFMPYPWCLTPSVHYTYPLKIRWEELTYFITLSAFIKSWKHVRSLLPLVCYTADYQIQEPRFNLHNNIQHFPPSTSFLPAWYLKSKFHCGQGIANIRRGDMAVHLYYHQPAALQWNEVMNWSIHSWILLEKRKGDADFLFWFYFFLALTLLWVSLEYMKKFYIWFEATEYTHAFAPRTKILSVCQTRWTNYKTKIHWSLIFFSSGRWNRLCQVLPWWKKRGLTLGLKKKWRNI